MKENNFETEEEYWEWVKEISERMEKAENKTFEILTGIRGFE